jgi:MFS family permease
VLRDVALASLLTPLNSTMIAVALPAVRSQFHVGASELTWLVSSYLIVVAVTQPAGGRLGDALGHLRVVRAGLILLICCSLAAGFAWSFPSLVAARSLQGITAGLVTPNVTAFLRRRMTSDRLGAGLGTNAAAVATGAAVGPIAGGLLLGLGGWRLLFFANVPLGVLALLMLLPQRGDPGAGRGAFKVDTVSFVALAGVFTGASLIGTAIQRPHGLVLPVAAGLLPLAAALYVVRYTARRSGVLDLRLFSRRRFWCPAGCVSISNLVQYTTLIAIPLLLGNLRGLDAERVGLVLFPMSGAAVAVSPYAGRVADRAGNRRVLIAGAVVLAAAAVAVAVAIGSVAVVALALLLALGGLGLGIQQVAQQSEGLQAWPPAMAGSVAGTLSMMRYVGSIIGAAMVAAMLGANPGEPAFRALLLAVAGVGLAGVAMAFALPRRPASL